MRIALIDYRAGNLTSVRKALAAVGAEAYTPDDPAELAGARGIVVPGVGHFGATAVLGPPWHEGILGALRRNVPLLGICLGLQWLFEGSEEAPALPGLAALPGRCHLLRGDGTPAGAGVEPRLKIPHVGWNGLERLRPSRILEGVADGAQAYFTHSFAAPVTPDCVASTTHGDRFAAVVERGLVFGAQFHPEKSGEVGLTLLRNFLEVARQGP
jgi:glutamine amidotransferase